MMRNYYEKMGIAIIKPKIYEGKLDVFDIDLMKSGVSPQTCRKLGGVWEHDILGTNCTIHINDVIDISIQDINFGRLFTERTAPTTEAITKEMKITEKGKAKFQIDCGQDTEDLNVVVGHLENPDRPGEPSYLKTVDFRCRMPPVEPGHYNIQAITPRGIVRSTFPEVGNKFDTQNESLAMGIFYHGNRYVKNHLGEFKTE